MAKPFTVRDSTLRGSDTLRGALTFQGDTVAIVVTDSGVIVNRFTSTETIAARLTEASATIATTLRTLDSLAVRLTDTAFTSVTVSTSDSTRVGLNEATAVLASWSRTDTIAVGLIERATLANTLSISDSLVIRETDVAVVSIASSMSETVSINLNPDQATIQDMTGFVSITSSDSAHLSIAELLTIQSLISTQDIAMLLLADAQDAIGAVLTTSEALLCGFGEAAEILGIYRTADSLAINISEIAIPGETIPVTAITVADACPVGMGTESIIITRTTARKHGHTRLANVQRRMLVRTGSSRIRESLNW